MTLENLEIINIHGINVLLLLYIFRFQETVTRHTLVDLKISCEACMFPFEILKFLQRVYCNAPTLLKLSRTQLSSTLVNTVNISVTGIFRQHTIYFGKHYLQFKDN